MKIRMGQIQGRVYAGYDEETGGYQTDGDVLPITVERSDEDTIRIGATTPGMDSEDAGFYLTDGEALQLLVHLAVLMEDG